MALRIQSAASVRGIDRSRAADGHGILDPTRVAASVWDAITNLLGRSRALLSAPPGPSPAAAPMYRGEAQFQLSEQVVLRSAAEPDAPDEVDTLFLGTPGD